MPDDKARVNCYTCATCGKRITTIDRDKGVTPMFLICKATPGCMGRMISAGYQVVGMSDLPPVSHEWYRDTDRHAKKVDKCYPGTFQHHKMGGLFLREIKR